MTGLAPIPDDEFEAALESLDPDDLVAFVAELWAVTADDVDVDPPIVTVRNGDARTDLVVAPAASDEARNGTRDGDAVDPAETADAVVLPAGSSKSADPETVSPADLRRRLLYALPTADADSLCERFLGVPARAGSYDREPPAGNDATGNDPTGIGAAGNRVNERRVVEDRTTENRRAADTSIASEPTPPSRSRPGGAADRAASGVDGRTAPDETPADATTGSRGGGSGVRRDRVAVAVVVVVLLATVAGAASLTGPSIADGIGDRLDPTDDPPATSEGASMDGSEDTEGSPGSSSTDPSPSESTESVDLGNSGTYTGVIDPVGPTDADEGPDRNGTAAARATSLEPTCERTPLHVVQIQLNALRYNDPATNDGIRTTRRFASPQNRRAVSSFEQFVGLFEGPNYAPMLGHDGVRYTPLGIDGDRATIEVVTYENGSATGRYEFRMRKVNAADASFTGEGSGYDGCWMTDAVGVLPTERTETTDADTAGDSGAGEDSVIHGPPGT